MTFEASSGLRRAIRAAERVLPGVTAADGDEDPRWQAVMAVAEFIVEEPEPVLEFALRWARTDDEDLRSAIACCVIEHLLEHHFELVFPRIETTARTDRNVASAVQMCWRFGRSVFATNAARLAALQDELPHA